MENFFFASENLPYLFATCILLALLVVELLGVLIGFSHSFHGDVDFHADLNGNGIPDHLEVDGFFSWINPSHVPLMIFVILFAATFSILGFSGQWVYDGLTGSLAPTLLSVPIITAATLAITRYTSAGVAAIMPRDITTAVTTESLIGLSGVVNVGPVSATEMGKARFTDQYGTDHNLFVFSEGDEIIALDEHVVLIGPNRDKSFAFNVRKISLS